jgi:photosystem II CP43 chlorophyll apoprotein
MTISLDRSMADNNPRLAWLIGNSRLVNFSGQLLGAHLAHAGLIVFWAGITTVGEALRFQTGLSLADQNFLLLPHLAMLGWGVGNGGVVVDTYPYLVIGMIHVVSSAVLAAGGLFHVFRAPANLVDGVEPVAKFHYEWTDGRQLGLILGHHLIFLGLGAWGLVLKATQWGGIYDASLHKVRTISAPTLDPAVIFGYLWGSNHGVWNPLGIASVSSLEDVVGGHQWLAGLLILGGIWHILVPPLRIVTKVVAIDADAVLSYSLGALALMAFVSCAFVGWNNTVFPVEFYGADRTTAAAVQFFLGSIALIGHFWHVYRSRTAAI